MMMTILYHHRNNQLINYCAGIQMSEQEDNFYLSLSNPPLLLSVYCSLLAILSVSHTSLIFPFKQEDCWILTTDRGCGHYNNK